MKKERRTIKRNRLFKYKLSLLLFTVVILISSFLGICQFIYMKNILGNNFDKTRQLIRDRVINIVNAADRIQLLFEQGLEQDAKVILNSVENKYNTVGNINFDLNSFIKSKKNMNLYIINNENKIVASTDKKDLGLDFKPWPDFVKYLDTIRKNSIFTSARLSLSIKESDMNKFSYMPSSDGKYIFEAGSLIQQNNSMLEGIGFNDFEESVVNDNDFVDRVILYDYQGVSYKKDNKGINTKIVPEHMECFNEAIKTLKSNQITGEYNGRKAFYQFIPYKLIDSKGVNEINVIEIIYNDISLQKRLRNNFLATVIIILLVALIAGSYGLRKARIITKPIEEITNSIEEIAKGNFDIKININTNDEFAILGKQFESMAKNIKNLLQKQKEHKQELEDKNKEISFQKEEITALYEETAAMNDELTNLLQENKDSYFETVRVLANAIEAKDSYTGGHCERVMEYSLIIGKALSLNDHDMDELRFGSILHDIGKIGIPENILNYNGSFTEKEFEQMRKHPQIGNDILKELHFIGKSRRIVIEHHERVDGKGYPKHLMEDQIDLLSKIVCVADAYDAMTSNRSYRKIGMSKETAIKELIANRGTQFNAKIIDVFVNCLRVEKI